MAKPSTEYIYGINPAFEVIRAGRRSVKEALLNKSIRNNPRIKKLIALLGKRSIPIEWVERGRLIDLSKSRDTQGVVLKSSLYPYVSFETLANESRLLLLDNVEDPHNVGGILRSAEVFGFQSVLLPLKGVPDIYPSVTKVSAGATEHLQIAKELSATEYVKRLSQAGFTIVALDAKGKTDPRAMNWQTIDKLLLVIGGEDLGVGQYILNSAQHVVGIPLHGRINSLNASVAAAIFMFAVSNPHDPNHPNAKPQ